MKIIIGLIVIGVGLSIALIFSTSKLRKANITLRSQVDRLTNDSGQYCQHESCLFADSSIVAPDKRSHCYWEREYAELCSTGYAGMESALRERDGCLRGWESEILRRKELAKELKLAAAELTILRKRSAE